MIQGTVHSHFQMENKIGLEVLKFKTVNFLG